MSQISYTCIYQRGHTSNISKLQARKQTGPQGWTNLHKYNDIQIIAQHKEDVPDRAFFYVYVNLSFSEQSLP